MADFNEFDGQGSTPSQDSGSIISHAFEMYKGVLTRFSYLYGLVLGNTASFGFQQRNHDRRNEKRLRKY